LLGDYFCVVNNNMYTEEESHREEFLWIFKFRSSHGSELLAVANQRRRRSCAYKSNIQNGESSRLSF